MDHIVAAARTAPLLPGETVVTIDTQWGFPRQVMSYPFALPRHAAELFIDEAGRNPNYRRVFVTLPSGETLRTLN